MNANSLRTLASVAAFCAALVVLAHLALVWGGASDFQERRRIAFDHGAALAIVLALTLWAGRVARWMERGTGRPIADAIAISGSIRVLLHLTWTRRHPQGMVTVRRPPAGAGAGCGPGRSRRHARRAHLIELQPAQRRINSPHLEILA